MAEEERLELVSTVEDQFSEPLERLETALEDADDEIRQTGGGVDSVRIDVETTSEGAVAELEAVNAAIESIDDDVTIDVETERDFTDAVANQSRARTEGGFVSSNLFEDFLLSGGEVDDDFLGDTRTGIDLDAAVETGSGVQPLTIEEVDPEVDLDEAINFGESDTRGQIGVEPTTIADLGMSDRDLDAAIEFGDDRDYGRGSMTARLIDRYDDLNFSMRDFHNILAAIIPLAAVFIGAIPSAVAGLAAVGTAALAAAGALAGIGVLGAAGMSLQQTGELSLQPIQERLSSVADTYVDAFEPLATSLAPTFEYLLTSIEDMAGPLATASNGLIAFRDEFRAASNFVESSLPSLTSGLLGFGHAVMPMLSNIVTWFSEADILGGLANELGRTIPLLGVMGNSLAELLPLVLDISWGFLVVATAITATLGFIGSLLGTIPYLTETVGLLTAGILAATSALTILNIALESAFIEQLTGVIVGIGEYVTALGGYIASSITAAYASYGLAGAIATVLSITTLGIAAVIGLGAAYDALANKIGGARSELDKFANKQQGMRGLGGYGVTNGGGSGSVYNDNSTTVIYSGDPDSAARQQYSSEYEHRQHVDSVFGSGV